MVSVHPSPLSNEAIASALAEIARHLRRQGAGEYRAGAYKRAAQTLRQMAESIESIYRRDHLQGVIAIPTIGRSIGRSIEEYLLTQRMSLLERLRGEAWPRRDSLSVRHEKQLRLWDEPSRFDFVPISELLSIDDQYRRAASGGQLAFDLTSHMPVMSIQRGARHYTVHFSNSPRAQRFHATEDWVVIERDDQHKHTKWTVMTSHDGKLHGCRTVRGRDEECYNHYRDCAQEAVNKFPMVWS